MKQSVPASSAPSSAFPASAPARTRTELGRQNRRAVLAQLVLGGPLSRTAIARETDLTMASVSRISRELIDAGLVRELRASNERAPGGQRASPGRRFVDLDIDPAGGYVLGIGVNVFSQSVTLANLKNQRVARVDLKLASLAVPDTVVDALTTAARQLVQTHVEDPGRLLGGSFAITGAVDPTHGVVSTSPYLGWGEVALGQRLSAEIGTPMRVESLPNAIALAETRFGVARGQRDVLLLNCSLGLGAALVVDGRLVRGRAFTAGLIGGIVPAAQARSRGSAKASGVTLDLLAGGHSVLKRLQGARNGEADLRADQLAAALMQALDDERAGNPEAGQALLDAGRQLAAAATQFSALVAPQTVIIAGPLAHSKAYVAGFRQEFEKTRMNEAIDIAISHTTGQAAARWLAIGECLIERNLALDELKLSSAA